MTWGRIGEMPEVTLLLKMCRERKVDEAMTNLQDRGKGSHLDRLKKNDVAKIDRFFTLLDLSDTSEESLKNAGIKIPDEAAAKKERLKQLRSDFR